MRQDLANWTIGYNDALEGKEFNPVGVDRLSYISGRIEGAIARLTLKTETQTIHITDLTPSTNYEAHFTHSGDDNT